MRKTWLSGIAGLVIVCGALFGWTMTASALEEGEITGQIEKGNKSFSRDYEKLDYKGQEKWEQWGKGLKSLGWIVVRGESGDLKDYLLLVIDTRTEIEGNDSEKGQFGDLDPGTRIKASYRLGWDALHAVYVKKLNE